jgi:hypothetical protein
MTWGWLVQNLSLRLILASSETIDPLTHCPAAFTVGSSAPMCILTPVARTFCLIGERQSALS